MADDTFVVDAPLPRIRSVSAHDEYRITVTWESNEPGERTQTVDLAPAVYRYKLYAALRDDAELFRTVQVIDDGFAIGWDGEDLDMASTTIAELAEQAMTSADFADFMKRNGYTLDSVAAELGISRRLAAYYSKEREIPRAIALACRYLDRQAVGHELAEVGISQLGLGTPSYIAQTLDAPVIVATGVGYVVNVKSTDFGQLGERIADPRVGFKKAVATVAVKPMPGRKVGGGKLPPTPDPYSLQRSQTALDDKRRG